MASQNSDTIDVINASSPASPTYVTRVNKSTTIRLDGATSLEVR